MKIFAKFLVVVVVVVTFGLVGSMTALAATTPSLGTADTFGVLVHTLARNFSGTAITGDLGYATSTGTGTYTVSGATHLANSAYNQAGVDQSATLIALDSQPCTYTFPAGPVDLATDISHGALGVYTPGVYCVAGMMPSVSIGSAGITLSGKGTYIFRFNSSLTTATNSVVKLDNGASACDVFWTLKDNAIISNFGAFSTFVGTLFDTVSLTLHNNVTWQGRAIIFGGTVSLSYDDKITVPDTCTLPPPPPSPDLLRVIKTVINDNGGTAVASDFNLHVKGSGSNGLTDVAGSPAVGVASPGRDYWLMADTYIVSEDTSAGYTATFSGDCDASGHVAVGLAPKTCTITNNDIAKPPPPTPASATLHVIKTVINDNGGQAVATQAVVHVATGSGDVDGSPQAGAGSPGTTYVLPAGVYTVSENFFPGYAVKLSGDCLENGNVALASGEDKTCTITNNDIAVVPPVVPPPTPPNPPVVIPPTCDICQRLTYDIYIINPDKAERHTLTPWVKVTDRGKGILRYSFEDATLDPRNVLFDHNDSVIDVDLKDCQSVKFMFVSSDASWKHQVRIKVAIDGVTQSDSLVVNDSKAVVGTSKTINATTGVNPKTACATGPAPAKGLGGKILLQVQSHGEAWYVNPKNGKRFYMANGEKAYGAMRSFGIGITNKDLAKIKINKTLAKKSSGKIFLQVESHGEAYYIDFNGVAHYLKDGAAAYGIMRSLGLGITNVNLNKIPEGSL